MRGAIFDLDGTLADTAGDLLAAANVALATEGLPQLILAEDKPFAGRGGRAMIRRSLTKHGADPDGAAEIALTDALYPRLLAAYEMQIAAETTLYDGVEACLDALEADDWRLGICTNKPERLARILMTELGVLHRFAALLGADTLPVRKPDPEHFFETCRQIGADPARSVMIGDTSTDLNTARAAGRPCILTTFGFAAEPLHQLQPDAIVDHYDQIPGVLNSLEARAISA
ncbi:phosphoglycolate phosphatase [Rhodobacteraceae bacterium NNCM2]|nr:phosphoglycolate phosphatase [Coraliihabitans acroporae]